MESTEQMQVRPESLFTEIDTLEKNLGPLRVAEDKALAIVDEAEAALALAKRELKNVRYKDDALKWSERARELLVQAQLPSPEDLGESPLADLRRLADPLCRWRKGLKGEKRDLDKQRRYPGIDLAGKTFVARFDLGEGYPKGCEVSLKNMRPGTLAKAVAQRRVVLAAEQPPCNGTETA